MAISFVGQNAGGQSNSTFAVATYTATAGNLLVLFVATSGDSNTAAVSSISDSASQVWTLATVGAVSPTAGGIRPGGYGDSPYGSPTGAQVGGLNTRIECWYVANTANITYVQINTATATNIDYNLSQWNGAALSSVVDVASPNPSGASISSNLLNTPTVNTTQATDLVISAFQTPPTTSAFNAAQSLPTTGWTALTSFGFITSVAAASYQVFTGTGAYRASWTVGSRVPKGFISVAFQTPPNATANAGVAGVVVSGVEPVTGSGPAGFSGIQGIGIRGASVKALQAAGSVSNPTPGSSNVQAAAQNMAPSVAFTAGSTDTVTAAAPSSAPQVTATAGIANVSASALNATVSTSAFATAPAGTATVTAASPSSSPSIIAAQTGSSVTVGAINATVSTSSNTTAPAGTATVSVAAGGVVTTTNAATGTASVSVASASAGVLTSFSVGQPNVSAASPSTTPNPAGQAGAGGVLVGGFNTSSGRLQVAISVQGTAWPPTVTTTPNAQAGSVTVGALQAIDAEGDFPGTATASVGGLQAVASTTSPAGVATVTISGYATSSGTPPAGLAGLVNPTSLAGTVSPTSKGGNA